MALHSSYDEVSVLRMTAAGEEAAFHQLYDHYKNKVYAIALRITGMESAAEDVVQEVFIKIWTNREKLEEITHFSSWLNTVTRHHIYNSLRKLAHEETFLRHLLSQKPAASDTMDAVAYNELHKLLDKAVSELTPQQKKVYLLSRIEGLSHEQIAKELGLTRETVRSYMKDALRSIRSFLRKYERLLVWLSVILMENIK